MVGKEKNFVSAVIYVHNAEGRVGAFLGEVIHMMEGNFEHSEIICVNDASEDGSLARVKEACAGASSTSVSVVDMGCYHGLEASMGAGVDLAIGDFVFEFDDTCLEFGVAEVMGAYRRSLDGYDIVSASPARRGRATSRLFYRAFDHFADSPYGMATESFRVISRRAVNRVSSMNRAVPYRKAAYANCGLKADNMRFEAKGRPRRAADRRERRYRAGLAVDALLLFTQAGYRFSVAMTAWMMLMSVFMCAYSIAIYATAHPVEGWTTTILFLSVALFGLFGALTVIIKYLQLLVGLVFKRKRYTFERVEKLTK